MPGEKRSWQKQAIWVIQLLQQSIVLAAGELDPTVLSIRHRDPPATAPKPLAFEQMSVSKWASRAIVWSCRRCPEKEHLGRAKPSDQNSVRLLAWKLACQCAYGMCCHDGINLIWGKRHRCQSPWAKLQHQIEEQVLFLSNKLQWTLEPLSRMNVRSVVCLKLVIQKHVDTNHGTRLLLSFWHKAHR